MADKDLQMQRKKSDGTFDKYYPKTKTHLVVDDTTGQTIKEQYNNIVNGTVIVGEANNANKLENKSASDFADSEHIHTKSEIIDFPASLPANGGTSASCSGNSATATKLQTPRTINGVTFDGTTNITIIDSTKAPISHTHTKANITDFPASLPANGGNAATLGGLALNTSGVNNVANQIVRTDGSGYLNTGYINTTSGAFTGTPSRIYASNDAYIRYMTLEVFKAAIGSISAGVIDINMVNNLNV